MRATKYIVPLVAALLVAAAIWFLSTRSPKVNAAAAPGELRWKLKVGGHAGDTSLCGDVLLCIGWSSWDLGHARLFAYDTATGKRLWTRKSDWHWVSQIGNETVYHHSGDARTVVAIEPLTGREKAELVSLSGAARDLSGQT